jgi:hypothetical protein
VKRTGVAILANLVGRVEDHRFVREQTKRDGHVPAGTIRSAIGQCPARRSDCTVGRRELGKIVGASGVKILTSRNVLRGSGSVIQTGSGQQFNFFGGSDDTNGAGTSKVTGKKIVIEADGKMKTLPSTIEVTGNASAHIVTDTEAHVTINGKTTIIPAPAGRVSVKNGEIYQNGKLFVTQN